ncbi:hypothetical protein TNCV_2600831 [Trichonephila clavipes]|nr:hypothetical protein TNCV_2600831 [Trichonephila clavipes]
MACSQNQAVFARRRSELKLKLELVEEKQKLLDIREKENAREVGTNNKITCVEVYFQRTIDKYSACVEVGKPIDENSACVEVGTTHKHLRRGVNLNNFKNYFSSNDITCEEVKQSVESTFLLDTSYVRATREPEKKKETATHIGIREAEDWFRPIDLAKECDIYISSRSGSHKEIPITYGYTQDPFKNKSQNFKPKIKENYPQYHERESRNCYICGDSSHYARDCKKRFKSKESNSHIRNKINVNTLKVESEKQNSGEIANLQYRMVEVKPINISLNQHSPSLSVRTAISPTLTEEFIIHPSIYSEIEKLGHAKSDVLLSESGSSLSADCGVSFPNVSVSNVIENSSYDLSHVKNFNTRNDSSSLIKDYKSLAVEAKEKEKSFEQTSRTLHRGKYRCVQPKINLLKRRPYACETQCFPVEPSGCRRGAFT